MRETDLASGTFYNYFDDKEDAFRAVFEEWLEQARIAAREKRLQAGISLEQRIYDSYHAYFELVVADPQMFELLRRNADAIAMLGSEDLFAAGVREFIEDMEQWLAEGQLTAEIEPWLPYIARSLAGGAFQIAAHMADEGASDVDATARASAPGSCSTGCAASANALASIGFTHGSSTKITIAARIGTETIRPTAPKSCPTTITPIAITAGCSFTVRDITTGSSM